MAPGNFLVEEKAAISALVEHIRWEGERCRRFFREMCAAHLLQLLVAYLRENKGKAGGELGQAEVAAYEAETSSVARSTLDFIKQHYAEHLDTQRVAHALGVSDGHLRHRFRESLGIPLMHYLAQYRVQRAKERINDSEDALKVVAEETGFKSIHHFNHLFLEISGETPGAWRRRNHEGICKDVCIDPHFSNVILIRQERDELAKSAKRPARQP